MASKKDQMAEVRRRMSAKVQKDIEDRDTADIIAGHQNPTSKMAKMAGEDAMKNRMGPGKPLTEEEGNETRKRLKKLYGAK